jgi:energy-coupling factor transport system substrate-specific component
MEKSKKINAKDLINVGIYTALYLVVFFVVGMLTAIPILYPALFVIWPIVTGIPFMLFLTKVEKPGMISIMSLILAVFWFMMGYTWIGFTFFLVFGLLSEIFFKAAQYKNFKLITIGYWIFSCGGLGAPANIWLAGDDYMTSIREHMGDQFTDQLIHYMPWWMVIVAFGLLFIGSVIGALLGRKMLKKHFQRAGIV